MEEKALCYCKFIKEFFPNSVLIPVPKDKKDEIQKLINSYLGQSWFEDYSKS